MINPLMTTLTYKIKLLWTISKIKGNISLQHENFLSSAPTKNTDNEKKTSKYFYHSASPPYYFYNSIVLNLAENGAINDVKAEYGWLSTLWCGSFKFNFLWVVLATPVSHVRAVISNE